MPRIYFLLSLLILMITVSLYSCSEMNTERHLQKNDSTTYKSFMDESVAGSFAEVTSYTFDSNKIKIFIDSFPLFSPIAKDLISFYRGRNFSYAWFDEKGLIETAGNLYNKINNIESEGLPDNVLYKNEFVTLMESENYQNNLSPFLDIMLTAQYLGYAKMAWEGLSKEKLDSIEWLLPRKEMTYQQLLDSLLADKAILDNELVNPQYFLLKNYLKKYSFIQSNGGWGKIEKIQTPLKSGDSSESIVQIKKMLVLTGDLSFDNKTHYYDDSLLFAIKKYQRRLGVKETGIISGSLLEEMNYPIEKRIQQIIVNMERTRWVPIQLKSDYLLVNIPDFKLHVFEKGIPQWNMNVVVGKYQNQTTVFSGEMKYVVFSPYWNIPASILKNETLPALKRNPNYLKSHNMEWNDGNVRQKPGPNNALGLVKFLFPNSHSIYLHDSPAKSLFNEDKRAFSHGCIRLAEAKKLAKYLLRDDSSWTEEKITSSMNSKKEQFVTLKKKLPVYITYFTAWVDKNGQLNFRQDVYKRDARLAKMIIEKPSI